MIVLDVETTGIYPNKNSIVSIGALDFSNPENQFYRECRVWEGAEITQEALDINGFTKEEITDTYKISLEGAVKDFLQGVGDIKDKTLAGENISFDINFLKDSIVRYGIDYYVGNRKIDLYSKCRIVELHTESYTHHIKRGLEPPMKDGRSDLNLNKTLEYVGLPEEQKPHHALTGANLEAEAFSRLIYGKSLLKEFEKYEVPDYLR